MVLCERHDDTICKHPIIRLDKSRANQKLWGCGKCFKMHDEIADPTLRCPTKEPRCSDEMGTTFEQRRRAMVAKEVKSKPSGTTITIKTMGSVKTKKIRWLWEQHIPLGKLTVFCGDPGGMKSMIAGDLAARGSVRTGIPDRERVFSV